MAHEQESEEEGYDFYPLVVLLTEGNLMNLFKKTGKLMRALTTNFSLQPGWLLEIIMPFLQAKTNGNQFPLQVLKPTLIHWSKERLPLQVLSKCSEGAWTKSKCHATTLT
ncbi:hypothetical protein AVEN_44828-1 [Araneus ventricosus]|uniref:Uncharacterized protein n=1 Tax=Araneus ventricosus TaxID=182803 RepID=A0A4Y2CKK1_ARAVE|nr:hypothetical protein AVEN_44828-1 [Araneus ventricosus]